MQIPLGLTHLGTTASGTRPAYLALELTGTTLDNTDPLASYVHLQTVNLSNNHLTTLSSLNSLQHLVSLNVSRNRLTQVRLGHLGVQLQTGILASAPMHDSIHNTIK